jgi:hypothetical protein
MRPYQTNDSKKNQKTFNFLVNPLHPPAFYSLKQVNRAATNPKSSTANENPGVQNEAIQ